MCLNRISVVERKPLFFVTLFLALFSQCGSSSVRRQASSLFHHRAFHSAIVIGNFLYIDGGDITTWDGEGDGFQYEVSQRAGNITTVPNNYTSSVDLRSTWSTQSVVVNNILKGETPSLQDGGLWEGPTGETFFAYGGGLTGLVKLGQQPEPPPNQLWEFTPSGALGSWSQVTDLASNFSSLVRTQLAVYTSSSGLGFAFGGWASAWTEANVNRSYAYRAPGMVIYNTTSELWYNVSAPGTGHATYGAGHFVPSFGPSGLLFVFGGYEEGWASLDWARIYDPASQQWYTQKVTGDIPPRVESPCVIGVQGDNDSYEIFMYGGRALGGQSATIEQAGAVHVLSLPSFRWHRQDISPQFGRIYPKCNVVGRGKRQMLVVGGLTEYRSSEHFNPWTAGGMGMEVDPWSQGIGVFDLSRMEWKDDYDPDAAPYVTPDVVKITNEQSPYPSEWSDGIIESWFTSKDSGDNGGSSGNLERPQDGGSSTNTGAIAGGVVGGVLGLALIAAIGLFLLRRSRKSMQKEPLEASDYHKAELDSPSLPMHEADGVEKSPDELYRSQSAELYGSQSNSPKAELP